MRQVYRFDPGNKAFYPVRFRRRRLIAINSRLNSLIRVKTCTVKETLSAHDAPGLKIENAVSRIRNRVIVKPQGGSAIKALPESPLSDKEVAQRFSDLFMIATDWFWELDAQLRFTYLSSRFEAITGIPADELIGKTRAEAFAGRSDGLEKWGKPGQNGEELKDYSMTWSLTRSSGEVKLLHTRAIPLFDKNNIFLGYRGVGTDITDSVDTLKALRQSEERFRNFAEFAADWFFELDASLTIVFYSCETHTLTSDKSSIFIGRNEIEVCRQYSEASEAVERYIKQLQAKQDIDIELPMRDDQGNKVYLDVIARPIFDADNNFCGYRGCSRDITREQVAKLELEVSERRFRNMLDNVTDIITTVDEFGVYHYYNSSIERILGYTPEEVQKFPVGGLALPEDSQKIIDAHNEAMNNPGRVVSATYRCRHKNGEIRVLESRRQLMQVKNSSVRELVVHARDVTDRYLAEKGWRESEQRMRDFAETAADWFWEQDKHFRFTAFSGAAAEYFPDGMDLLIGKTREECAAEADLSTQQWQDLKATLNNHLPFANFEYELKSDEGKTVIVRVSGKPVFNEDGEFSGYRGTAIDISESHRLSQQLSYQATHDPLTGLINRREFEMRLNRVINDAQAQQSEHALCYIDLDQFKVVNDTCGHDAGDELLRQISSLLEDKVRKRDTISRLGGDEFGLLLERCSLRQANRVAETVCKTINDYRFVWAGRSFKLGASVGVIPINQLSGNISEVMRAADAACYTAKDAGRNRIHVHEPGGIEVADRHAAMQRIVEINRAFDEERLVLHQQSIVSLHDDDPHQGSFCEVLVRMLDDKGELMMPDSFMPVAERYNLSVPLDTWVINACLVWMQGHQRQHCSINLSGASIADETFLRHVLATLEKSGIEPSRICFEITETAAIANLKLATRFINQLRELGCRFALDDFGSGLSSFAYLKTLPVDFLKIDGFFVRDIIDDPINLEMVKSINDIGHVMGKQTIAEFVENDEIKAALKAIGVDYGQGYGISRPVPIDP